MRAVAQEKGDGLEREEKGFLQGDRRPSQKGFIGQSQEHHLQEAGPDQVAGVPPRWNGIQALKIRFHIAGWTKFTEYPHLTRPTVGPGMSRSWHDDHAFPWVQEMVCSADLDTCSPSKDLEMLLLTRMDMGRWPGKASRSFPPVVKALPQSPGPSDERWFAHLLADFPGSDRPVPSLPPSPLSKPPA